MKLSNYVVDPSKENLPLWNHAYLQTQIGLGPNFKIIFANVLNQQTDYEEDSGIKKFYQLLALELEDRGYFVPDLPAHETEEMFLNRKVFLSEAPLGFFHTPKAILTNIPEEAQWGLFGVPCDLGATKPGCRYGPQLIRERSLSYSFRGNHKTGVYSLGSHESLLKNLSLYDLGNMEVFHQPLPFWIDRVEDVIQGLPLHCKSLMIGGDHSLTLGAIRGLIKKRKEPFT